MTRVYFLGAVALVLVSAATARLFVWPSTDAVRRVDAVVVFAGGRGERLARAEQLMENGAAANLVVANGLAPEWKAGNRACTERRRYVVFCPTPKPDTTRGEARSVAALAAARGWGDVAVVTSRYQLARAGLLLSRCFDGEVLTVAADPSLGPLDWARRLGHEWFGWGRAVAVDRHC